ncbi:MAG: type II toxin-antitoxin system PemK/MazF family toxin [Propionibacteriaceae bacterium]|nr:type II toxin-antitoxin system PemK/MazF family toxin [Propionibacteriaceae bacterium]
MRYKRSKAEVKAETYVNAVPAPYEYPGDFVGTPTLSYEPFPDNKPDPGEVVWGWVPYEENHKLGKDRPVLIIGRDGKWLLALMLTSQDHDRDKTQEAYEGRYWVEIGRGPWDRKGRVSEVRVNRIIRMDPSQLRRPGGEKVPAQAFERVAKGVCEHAGRK